MKWDWIIDTFQFKISIITIQINENNFFIAIKPADENLDLTIFDKKKNIVMLLS